MSTLDSHETERLRQLRAAHRGAYHMNGMGRYVIDGEARPDRIVRERLRRADFITWPHYVSGNVEITRRGLEELQSAEHRRRE